VFTSERGAPFTTAGFARMVERAGTEAKLGFKAHPHMLRHAWAMLWRIRATIRGRSKSIGSQEYSDTVRYTELSPERFKNLVRYRCLNGASKGS
jgi:site-specific recombinase XerD